VSAIRAALRACSEASVTIALSFGLISSITARWASSNSMGLTSRARMSRASSRADLRVRLTSAMDVSARAGCLFFESSSRSDLLSEHDLFRKPVSTFRNHALFAGPVDEAPLDQKEQQVEAIAQRA